MRIRQRLEGDRRHEPEENQPAHPDGQRNQSNNTKNSGHAASSISLDYTFARSAVTRLAQRA
jgi:hypothetical protein